MEQATWCREEDTETQALGNTQLKQQGICKEINQVEAHTTKKSNHLSIALQLSKILKKNNFQKRLM